MKKGYLSEYFTGFGLKRLSAVEIDSTRSNQHEFNGVDKFRILLGEPEGKCRYKTKFLYLNDLNEEPIGEDGYLTWYDARQRARQERNIQRWEYRLYFPTTLVSERATQGDLLLIAKTQDETLIALLAEQGSTIEQQILWLFGYSDSIYEKFTICNNLESDANKLSYAAKIILEYIGVELHDEADTYLEDMLIRFDGGFPKTQQFSAYARSILDDISAKDDPDAALMAWMEQEEILFRTLEKHLLKNQLKELQSETEIDIDAFCQLSLSIQNRRKARAGNALENHIEEIFLEQRIRYSRTAITENKLKPDFIFPSIADYHNQSFPANRLSMLGVKTTCKDRWRQVINEAARIPLKHLLTLEPRISENQTKEMQSENVQLVIPFALHKTYTTSQQDWLLSLKEFIEITRNKE